MENEKAELMVTIQKGEGFDTAIQQLQQDNVNYIFYWFLINKIWIIRLYIIDLFL